MKLEKIEVAPTNLKLLYKVQNSHSIVLWNNVGRKVHNKKYRRILAAEVCRGLERALVENLKKQS